MKKGLVLFVITLLFSSLFVSCGEKTKEERFLSDLEELVEKAEAIKTKEDAEAFEKLDELFGQKVGDLYGVKNIHKIDESNLNFSDDQKEEFYKLVERAEVAVQKAKERIKESESSDDLEDSNPDNLEEKSDTSENASSEVEELLDSYEEYVDNYIAYFEKASKGDMSALSEYSKLMEKAQDLGRKLDNCKDDMTPSQISRYTEISLKMLSSMKETKE